MYQHFPAALKLYCILTLVSCVASAAATPFRQARSSSTTTCVLDPNDETNLFSIINAKGVPLINRNRVVGPLLESDFDASNPDIENWSLPTYHFHQPPNAAPSSYDLVMDDPALGPLYVGMDANRNAILTDTSSNGFGPVIDSQGRRVKTTLFGLSCQGKLSINANAKTFIWEIRDNHTVFTKTHGPQPAEAQTLILPKVSRKSRNSIQRGGDAPRCPSTPFGLYSVVRPGARDPEANGCGSGSTAGLVPEFAFHDCCNNHDFCYDNCPDTFESCNDVFDTCLHDSCRSTFSGIFNFFARFLCHLLADGYAAAVTGSSGISAFESSTQDRCECLCPLGNQLCAGQCPNFSNDNNNCGGCGQICPPGLFCSGGSCSCPFEILGDDRFNCGGCGYICANGFRCSRGSCVCDANTDSDAQNCGACGHVCPDGQWCEGGYCRCPPDSGGRNIPFCS